MFTFPVTFLSGGRTLTFWSRQSDLSDASVYTFSNVDIGPANARRLVIVTVHTKDAASAALISSATIGGVAATIVDQDVTSSTGGRGMAAIISAVVPTGTTATIAITMASSRLNCTIGVFTLTGYTSATAHDTASDSDTSTNQTVNLDIPAGGILIACSSQNNGQTATQTGVATEHYDVTSGEISASLCEYTGCSSVNMAVETNRAVTFTWSGNTGVVVVAASWA